MNISKNGHRPGGGRYTTRAALVDDEGALLVMGPFRVLPGMPAGRRDPLCQTAKPVSVLFSL